MTNWSLIGVGDIYLFANGELSGRGIYNKYKNTKAGGVVRNLLRNNGVDRARKLALKAARRRFNKINNEIKL